jgi:CRP-like cAMP-binding protein
LKSLLPFCRQQSFKKGEYIIREGDRADELYVITSGQVVLEMRVIQPSRRFHGNVALTTVTSFQPIVLWALVPPYEYPLSARAFEDTLCVAIDCVPLRVKMDSDAEFGSIIKENLNQLLALRLQQVREVLAYERAFH